MNPTNYDTISDSGTKTASFTGATQNNMGDIGALILIKFGTVSGTSPTCNVQLQWSYDGGTNFLNLGPASGNATSTNNTIAVLIYPTNLSQAAGVTPANLTTGATQTLALNIPLPRIWRLNFTIGGTTPSFALINVYISYVL